MKDMRYPIGRFEHDGPASPAEVSRWIDQIEALPQQMRKAVENLSRQQLDIPYRPGGWTLRQVVHHVPDSHLNSYVRFKWALTEDNPTIKPYDQEAWANLADYESVAVETSLDFLALLHAKWVPLLRSLGSQDLSRGFVHPELGAVRLDWNIGLYAWHGRHHLAHITEAVESRGWAKP